MSHPLFLVLIMSILPLTVLVTPIRAQADNPSRIQNALSAAPASIASQAAVVEWPTGPGETMAVLREGTNGWTCLPDRAVTPLNDPMCHDEVFMQWLRALMTGEEPRLERVGFSYMLQGGAGASQSDPYATTPPPGEEWVIVGPHVMMVVPNPAHLSGMSHDHESGGPFTDFAKTPYQIIIIPVAAAGEVLSAATKE